MGNAGSEKYRKEIERGQREREREWKRKNKKEKKEMATE